MELITSDSGPEDDAVFKWIKLKLLTGVGNARVRRLDIESVAQPQGFRQNSKPGKTLRLCRDEMWCLRERHDLCGNDSGLVVWRRKKQSQLPLPKTMHPSAGWVRWKFRDLPRCREMGFKTKMQPMRK